MKSLAEWNAPPDLWKFIERLEAEDIEPLDGKYLLYCVPALILKEYLNNNAYPDFGELMPKDYVQLGDGLLNRVICDESQNSLFETVVDVSIKIGLIEKLVTIQVPAPQGPEWLRPYGQLCSDRYFIKCKPDCRKLGAGFTSRTP
jgi:hypothetical protein